MTKDQRGAMFVLIPTILLILTFAHAPVSYAVVEREIEVDLAPVKEDELLDLAIEKGFVPLEYQDQAVIDRFIAQKQTLPVWIMMPHNQRVDLIENLKQRLAQDKVAVIRQKSDVYVSLINEFLYDMLKNEDFETLKETHIRGLLETLSMMRGDYDNGTPPEETIRQNFGEDMLKRYQEAKEAPQLFRGKVPNLRDQRLRTED